MAKQTKDKDKQASAKQSSDKDKSSVWSPDPIKADSKNRVIVDTVFSKLTVPDKVKGAARALAFVEAGAIRCPDYLRESADSVAQADKDNVAALVVDAESFVGFETRHKALAAHLKSRALTVRDVGIAVRLTVASQRYGYDAKRDSAKKRAAALNAVRSQLSKYRALVDCKSKLAKHKVSITDLPSRSYVQALSGKAKTWTPKRLADVARKAINGTDSYRAWYAANKFDSAKTDKSDSRLPIGARDCVAGIAAILGSTFDASKPKGREQRRARLCYLSQAIDVLSAHLEVCALPNSKVKQAKLPESALVDSLQDTRGACLDKAPEAPKAKK